jgi:Flp pilus assembly pilin Flp
LEYTIIVGIVTVVLFYMGTGIKRGLQSLVKITADQVGNQQNADQDFDDIQTGYMKESDTNMQESKNKQVTETGYTQITGVPVYTTNMNVNEYSETVTNTITNGGFTQTNQ